MRLHTRCRMSADREREIRAHLAEGWTVVGNAIALDLLSELDALREELRMTRLHMTERLRDRQTECQALLARAMRAEAEVRALSGQDDGWKPWPPSALGTYEFRAMRGHSVYRVTLKPLLAESMTVWVATSEQWRHSLSMEAKFFRHAQWRDVEGGG